MTNLPTPSAPGQDKPPLALRLVALCITLATPILLVMFSVRLVMTPLFLQLVYNRPGFPADFYGFTTQERLRYAPRALEYLLNAEDISYLGNMRFADGQSMYNARELHHMQDVKWVTQVAFIVVLVLAILITVMIVALIRKKQTRPLLRRALLHGSLLTLAAIFAIVIVAIFNWNVFFNAFHQFFFESGTWRFQYSDTLIRLFPEQFWFEAVLAIGCLTFVAAGLVYLLAGRRKSEYDI
ncbi:MAG: TIGR01906 family membrane protein [Chloroflexi bacterium]|nr:TIGR01906 family membrane protein [Chloroflexota bacterium]